MYSGSGQIRTYLDDFCSKHALRRFIRPSHTVTSTVWDAEAGEWAVEVRQNDTGEMVQDRCDLLVHATGYLNKPEWPKVPGLDAFKGPKLHSADYDESIDLTGKRVLLVGAGSSAVQILPAIQPIASHVKTFIRSPSWFLPQITTRNGDYTDEEIRSFIKDPSLVTKIRLENERAMNSIFTIYMKGTVLQAQSVQLLSSEARRILDDPEVEAKLIPDFAVGCKRIIPTGSRYLQALKRDNVDMVFTGVSRFTESGCVDDEGVAHEGDVVICATGFDTSYIPRYPIRAHGRNLQHEWAQKLNGYMGVGVAGFPNTFTMLGPYSPVSNGPTLAAVESQADYICAFVDRWQTEASIKTVTLRPQASADFTEHVDNVMRGLVWTDGCRNSHNNHSPGSRVPTTWPGSSLHYLEAMREVRFDDWEFTHSGNRFSFLGTGISQTEWDPTSDSAYYIRTEDDGKHGSRRMRNLAIAKTGSMPPRQLHRQAKLGPKASLDGSHEKKASVVVDVQPAIKVEAAATVTATSPPNLSPPRHRPRPESSLSTAQTLPGDGKDYCEPRSSKLYVPPATPSQFMHSRKPNHTSANIQLSSSKIRKHWSMIVRHVS